MNKESAKNIYKKIKKWWHPFLRFSSEPKSNGTFTPMLWTITITKGALDKYNVQEMAMLLGHELGHVKLSHIFGFKKDHDKEYDADEHGAKLIKSKGYSLKQALKKFDKMTQRETMSHPHPQKRKQRLIEKFNVK